MRKLLIAAVVACLTTAALAQSFPWDTFKPYPSIFAQDSKNPIIVRRVHSETARDPRLEEAISSALNEGGTSSNDPGAHEEIRYYYNKVDLNGDGKPEVLVFLFGKEMCGTGGCRAFVFQRC
jgi:hypothetical protein